MALKKISKLNRAQVPGIGTDKNIFVKAGDFNPVVDEVNNIQGSGTAGTIVASTLSVSGASTLSGAVSLGTDITLVKEVNHTFSVDTTTTAATVGASLVIVAAAGATTGAGGVTSITGGTSGTGATGNGGVASVTGGASAATNGTGGVGKLVGGAGKGTGAGGATQVTSGNGGATGTGGKASLSAGAGGSTSGNGGGIDIVSGFSTVGSSGTINILSGDTSSGVAGDVILSTGASTSTTVVPTVTISKAHVRKPSTKTTAVTTLTGPELVGGYIEVTGATGNLILPAVSAITTAIGSTPAGTSFEFIVNAVGMTATNTATVTLGANMTWAKQTAFGLTGNDQLNTVTNTAGLVSGVFKIVFVTSTACYIHRIA